jgi:hypothetical protein
MIEFEKEVGRSIEEVVHHCRGKVTETNENTAFFENP